MSVSASQRQAAEAGIPEITCPVCGARMRLAAMEPRSGNEQSRMIFDCKCGFEYRVADRA
jgi:hypothetical protein